MSDFAWQTLRSRSKRNLRLTMPYAVIGDEAGNIYDTYLQAHVLVRMMYANGYGKAFPVLGPAGNSVVLVPGTPVKLGQTSDGKLQIEGYDVAAATIAGT